MRTSGAFLLVLVLIFGWVLVSSGVAGSLGLRDDPLLLILPCVALIAGYAVLLGCARQLSPREVDTVYYLGFLTTLAVLGTSVVRLTQEGAATDPAALRAAAAHFALGLLATGAGLIARLLLQQKTAAPEALSGALERYIDAMARLSDRMDDAVVKFERLTEETLKGAGETSRKAADAALTVISQGLKPVSEEICGSMAQVNASLRQIDGARFEALSDGVERLERSMSGLERVLGTAEESVRSYDAQLASSTAVQARHANSSDSAAASFRTLGSDLTALVSAMQAIPLSVERYTAQLGRTCELQDGYVQSTAAALAALEAGTAGLTELTAGMTGRVAALSQAAAEVDLESLRSLGGSLKEAVAQLNTLGTDVEHFARTIRGSHSAVSEVRLKDFSVDFQRQGDLVKQAAQDLGQAMVQLSTELGTAIHEGLRH